MTRSIPLRSDNRTHSMKIKYKIAKWIYHRGPDWGGCPSPPGTECVLHFGDVYEETGRYSYVATTYNNDGFELWIGTPNKWHVFYSAKQARRLAWFILWDWWFVSTWFGVKRKIWYWALHLDCERQNISPPVERTSRRTP